MPSFDYIIIGAGTAGALMANRLSDAKGLSRVLLLEAGGHDDYHWIHIPVGYLYCIGNPRTDWLYQTEADPGLNGRTLRYPRGKTLGGCSSINGMIYMRGQVAGLRQLGSALVGDARPGGWEHMPALLHAMHEDHHKGASALHGARGVAPKLMQKDGSLYRKLLLPRHNAGGEWRVEKQRLRWDVLDAFAQAAAAGRHSRHRRLQPRTNEGVGYFEVNQKAGFRWNTAKAFLRPTCFGRPNFEMWTGAQVRRLLTERGADGGLRCTGAEVVTPHGIETVTATREVILCAGSIGSPQILQLSGIGPGGLLRQHGIEVKHDLPGVGENLQDHLQIRSVYKVQGVKTLNTLAATPWGKAKIGLEYLLRRTGPMSMAPSQLGAFTRTSDAFTWPNIEYHVQPLSLDAFGQPLHMFNAFTASVCNLNPTSRGHVRITSPRHEDAPAIFANYLSTPEDRQVAADSLRVTRRIVAQPAMRPYQPEEFKPGVRRRRRSRWPPARRKKSAGRSMCRPRPSASPGKRRSTSRAVRPRTA